MNQLTMSGQTHKITSENSGMTVAAFLRSQLPGQTWKQARQLVEKGRVRIDEQICRDSARRLKTGETLEILERPVPVQREENQVKIRHMDEHVVVVEKPAGMCTVRHPLERAWSAKRKALSPTLEDIIPKLIAGKGRGARGKETGDRRPESGDRRRHPVRRLRVVHRLDKETSGLVVFARTVAAERSLGKQFHAHTVIRRYLAVVPGQMQSQRVASFLVRDRGDGRRGSTRISGQGKVAITHFEVEEELPGYTVLSCRLETGRTHQIRIHLAELGHPVCGEKVYHVRDRRGLTPPLVDMSGAPRLALHAAELGFVHPVTGETLHWTMPLPRNLREFVERLRSKAGYSKDKT